MSKKDDDLKKIAEGGSVMFLGSIAALILGYAYTLVIARYIGPSKYGMLSIGVSIITLLLLLSKLGLDGGIKRFVPFYYARKQKDEALSVVFISLKIVTISSIVFALLFFSSAEWIALHFFGNPSLVPFFRILFLGTPFWAVARLVLAISIGFKNLKYPSYLENMFKPLFILLASLLAIILKRGAYSIALIYSLSFVLLFALSIYFINSNVFKFKSKYEKKPILRSLLSFSIPVIAAGFLWALLRQIDTLMVGFLMDTAAVGVYNVAYQTSSMLLLFFTPFAVAFLPVISGLFSLKKISKMRNVFVTTSKWIVMVITPFFLFLVFFSRQILLFFFGKEYATGHMSMLVLAVGFFIVIAVGPTTEMLNAIGRSKLVMFNLIVIALVDIVLNYYLILCYGILGAGIATTISYCVLNILTLWEVFHFTKAKPPIVSIFKIFLAGLLAIILPSALEFYYPIASQFPFLGILFILYAGIYALLIILFKILEKEDVDVVLELGKRIGVNLGFFKKFFAFLDRRFE